jgi:hypothetical protein
MSKQSNTQDFIQKAINKHGNKCDYSLVEYVKSNTKVKIICNKHGSFWQRPDHHYRGSGCSSCQNFGYRPNLEGNFYILRSGNITKVGICNRPVEERLKNISKSSGKVFTKFFELQFNCGKLPLIVETEVLRYLKSIYKSPKESFDGSTECFYDVDIFELLEEITNLGEKYD